MALNFMNAPNESLYPQSSAPLPNSERVYLPGTLHPSVQVPMRKVSLAQTRLPDGSFEQNESVLIYDVSGPWGDPTFTGTVEEGLPAARAEWIRARGDVEEYDGRGHSARDDGYLSEAHAAATVRRAGQAFAGSTPASASRRPLRGSAGHPVTQLWYARQGIITPEMEYIAIRENQGLERLRDKFSAEASRDC